MKGLFPFLSFKEKKPVFFKYPNLLGVANNVISHYPENGDLILKAITKFGCTEKINELDKRGTFKRKKAEYLENKPTQNKEFESIVIELFPELNYI